MRLKKLMQTGFTVVELMTGIAVVAVAASVAVPSFNTVINNNRRVTAVNQMVSTMHAARSEAITRNSQVTICPSTDGASCSGGSWKDGWIFFPDLNGDRTVQADEPVLGASGEHPHMDIDSREFPNLIVFRPNGRVLTAAAGTVAGSITFCDPRGADHARAVIVSSSGGSRLEHDHAGGLALSCP